MLPKLNLDGTLKKRTSSVQERMTEEGQPGVYSPRISSSQAPKLPAGAGGDARLSSSSAAAAAAAVAASSSAGGGSHTISNNNAAISPSSSTSNSPSHSLSAAPVLPSPHSSPHEMSLVEDGLVGISDPEMATILAAKSRHGSADRSPLSDRVSSTSSPGPGSGNSPPGKRRAAPLATLVDHQQARQPAAVPAAAAAAAAVAQGNAESGASADGVAGKSTGGEEGGDAKGSSASAAAATTSSSSASLSSVAAKRRAGLALTSPRQSSTKGRPTSTTTATGTASAGQTGEAAAATPSASMIATMTAEEVYISGKPFHDYMSAYAARAAPPATSNSEAAASASNGGDGTAGSAAATASTTATTTAAAGAHITTTFHQNPSQYISALASQGDFVAVGDRTGRVVVMRQREMAATARRTLLDTLQKSEEAEEAEAERRSPGRGTAPSGTPSPAPRHIGVLNHVRDPFEFHVAQQAYVPVIDTLNSVEVAPNVTALAFLPQSSPTTYLLASNEKVPKLYKIMSVRESANSFRAVDKIGTKTIGPLTASSRASTVAMKPVARYALSHEYNIHSICPIAFSDQFATADDATVLLWCTEYPDTSIEAYDLRSPYDDGPREAIRCVRAFPHEPFLFFVATSAGTVRVVDTRQTLRWVDQSAQVFSNPTRDEDEPFSNVTNSICDCALSPSGRYIAGRDFMSVCLWDIRMAGSGGGGARNTPASPRRASASPSSPRGESGQDCGVVRRWELHPFLRPDLESIYQSNLLFERFDVQFLSGNQVCTGGFNNTLYTMNVEGTSGDPGADIRTFQLPKTEGISDFRRTTVSAHTPAEDKASTGQGLGSRMTLMSRPSMSMSASCGMVVACGQAVLQLSYNGALA